MPTLTGGAVAAAAGYDRHLHAPHAACCQHHGPDRSASGIAPSLVAGHPAGACRDFRSLRSFPLVTAHVPVGLLRDGIFSDTDGFLFGLSDQATFAAATFLGLFIGAIGFGAVADRFGRRPIFVWALVGYSVATLAMALQTTALGILCLSSARRRRRLGIELVTGRRLHMVEIVPKHMRGKAAAIIHSISYLAIPLLAFTRHYSCWYRRRSPGHGRPDGAGLC